MSPDGLSHPEYELLHAALGNGLLARCLARAPGGWRDLTEAELVHMKLSARRRRAVLALQVLAKRSYPELPKHVLSCSREVAAVYGARLGGLMHEVVVAVALNGRSAIIGEVQVAEGGAHGACVTPADILRSMIRMGASAFILVHNHPSGCPVPSQEDVALTVCVARAGAAVGLDLVDHVVIGARGGGFASLFDLGLMEPPKEKTA